MAENQKLELKNVFNSFQIYGDFIEGTPYGNGHINDTFKITALQAGTPIRYILQKLNSTVFKEPAKLMENVHRICLELHRRLALKEHPDASRRALRVILSLDNKPYHIDKNGNFWRLYFFIERTVGYDIAETSMQAFQAALAFGEFQKLLTDLPGARLHETIPDFHNTPVRMHRFQEVLKDNPKNRSSSVREEIDFFLSRNEEAKQLTSLAAKGKIPERVTHNDTKLNNVLIDTETDEAVCVIDLDTAMSGLVPYDFGDLVRTSTSPVAEDEPDVTKVTFKTDMFKALVKGYLSSAASFLTETERKNLVLGGILMTYEVGLRFLTDYVEGDTYFKTKYAEHNLVRCRNQIALTKAIESRRTELEDFVEEQYKQIHSQSK